MPDKLKFQEEQRRRVKYPVSAMRLPRFLFPFAAISLLGAAFAAPAGGGAPENNVLRWRGEQPVRARHGMVVSVHHLASDAGLEILREGGNAVDAAVATGFALAVVHPAAGNLGGGGFLLLRTHDGRATFIDYREKAPLAATETMYQDAQGNVIPGASITGYRAIGTPGSVAGMVYAEREYGKLGLAKVMAPAIRLASDGFTLSNDEAGELHSRNLSQFPDSRRIFQRNGDYYKPGETFRQPELARTLQRIAADPDDFYRGKMAQELVGDLRKGGALLTLQDLAQYNVVERKPVLGTFHNYTIISAPPPSSGGIVLISALNILEGYDLKKLGDRTPASLHLITEAWRRAFMDRAQYMGDPDFNPIPTEELISKRYAAAWRAGISPDRAPPSADLKRPSGFLPPPPTTAGVYKESNQTTHYSVVDSEGNAVAVTTTLNNGFGSGVTAGSLGFLLNDEMDDFTSKPGVPNMYGLVQGVRNDIEPGKRPLSSMAPTIVTRDGKVAMVTGSPGGSRIITIVLETLLNALVYGMNVQQAVDAPRTHMQWLPDQLQYEPGAFSDATASALRTMGYSLDRIDQWGSAQAIVVDPSTGTLYGGTDRRRLAGSAIGY